jgi:3-hydroxyisobutyrate dehydrogenase
MASHILDGGYQLHVNNRTKSKADALVARGATWHDHPGEVAAASDVVITVVGYPSDVESCYFGSDGILDKARPGSVLIDMTTSSPTLAEAIAADATSRGVSALDAPVSGGDVGARNANLAIMAGGDEAAYDQVLSVLQLMGSSVVRMGEAGAGQHTKMVNQIAIASTMLAVTECISYAGRAGLDRDRVLDIIGKGAASSFLLNGLGRKMILEDFSPGFFIHHFIKDLEIALNEAARMKLDLPGAKLARTLYGRLSENGFDEEGTQALYRLYNDLL